MGGVAREREQGVGGTPYSAREWKETLQDIVGRSLVSRTKRGSPTEIGNSYWVREGAVVVIFDVSDFQELTPTHRYIGTGGAEKKNAFRSNSPELAAAWKKMRDKFPDLKLGDSHIKNYKPYSTDMFGGFNEDGLPTPDSESGFILSPRVPPRRFKGIVIGREYATDQEIKRWGDRI